MHASGICYTDVHMTMGHLLANFPITLGHDPAGEVVEVGEGVASLKEEIAWACLGCNLRAANVNGVNVESNYFARTR